MLDPEAVWGEFLDMLSAEQICAEKIRPLHEAIKKEALYHILHRLSARVPPVKWPRNPSVRLNGNQLVYVVTLESEGEPTNFVFRFEVDGNHWFFRHVETILTPLDSIPPCRSHPSPTYQKRRRRGSGPSIGRRKT